MGFKVFLFCCLLAVSHSNILDLKLPKLGTRIIGGKDAVPGQFPYQVSLQLSSKYLPADVHFCGGTIIDENFVLTAVHCIIAYEQYSSLATLVVKAGKHELQKKESNEQVVDVDKYYKHKNYDEVMQISPYDIAVIKLRTPLKFNAYVAKAVLPQKGSEPTGNVTLSGWGAINSDSEKPIEPKVLQTVLVPIVDRKTCNEAIKKVAAEAGEQLNIDLVDETNICTGPLTGGISACGGDSGGPLVRKNEKNESEVVGIVSWGLTPCGRKGAPAVFVRVSSFIDWIADAKNSGTSTSKSLLLVLFVLSISLFLRADISQ